MASEKFILGSRGSQLALKQANWVKTALERSFPDHSVEVKIIRTSGDVIADAPLSQIGGKGLFTKEIEEALLERQIHLAVQSLKDLPTQLPVGLCLAAITAREDARDALVSKQFGSLAALPIGARIGTSSLRRQSQLLHLRRDLRILNLRGNLDTRLRKLETDQYDGIVLASAGLIRLGHADLITAPISVEELCPAVGQGALGIEARSDDTLILEKLQRLNHPETQLAAEAERAFLRKLGGGCQVPIAGYAQTAGERFRIQGVIASPDGLQLFRDSEEAKVEGSNQAQAVGQKLADKMLAAGAQAVVDEIFHRI